MCYLTLFEFYKEGGRQALRDLIAERTNIGDWVAAMHHVHFRSTSMGVGDIGWCTINGMYRYNTEV